MKIIKTVKPLKDEKRAVIVIPDKMFWHSKVGQITCCVVVYDKATQYLVRQEKDGKIYDNFYGTYEDMISLYNFNSLKSRET